MPSPLITKLNKALGSRIISSRALPGGDIADVSLLSLENHTQVVAKRPRADQPDTTAIEALMLTHLAEQSSLPVPKVLFQDNGVLVISYIPHKGITDPEKAAHSVAEQVAALHKVHFPAPHPTFGFKCDTVIGPLPQHNKISLDWVNFYGQNRLMVMARSCYNTGKFDEATLARIERLTEKLPDFLPRQPESSLLHGDLWAGNMLIDGTKAKAFIDPAVSYGHREIDLAFVALMGGLSEAFFDAYDTLYKLEPGFHNERKTLYQLWPLLVHVRLFGSGYVSQVTSILDRFGV